MAFLLEGDIPDELGLDDILEVVRNLGKNCWHKNWTWELEDLGSNPDRNWLCPEKLPLLRCYREIPNYEFRSKILPSVSAIYYGMVNKMKLFRRDAPFITTFCITTFC